MDKLKRKENISKTVETVKFFNNKTTRDWKTQWVGGLFGIEGKILKGIVSLSEIKLWRRFVLKESKLSLRGKSHWISHQIEVVESFKFKKWRKGNNSGSEKGQT